jgi:hypothetical protein
MKVIAPLVLVALPALLEAANPRIDSEADAILHRMSDHLARLRSFRVEAQSVNESVMPDGERIDSTGRSRVAVRRPDRLRVDHADPSVDVSLRYDSREIVVYSRRTGYYSVTPAPERLDAAIDTAREKWELDARVADLMADDPYAALMSGVSSARYVGLETIDEVPCQHLAFRGDRGDWQIWIQTGAEPLPRRYAIVSPRQDHPKFTVDLSHWQPDAPLSDEEFIFHPPPGARPISQVPLKGANR